MFEGATQWDELIQKYCSALSAELPALLDSEVVRVVAAAVAEERAHSGIRLAKSMDTARRAHAEVLNQTLRRLRDLHREEAIFDLVAKSCAPFAAHVVVLVFGNNQAHVVASHGVTVSNPSFLIESAPAVITAIETCDPVAAAGTSDQISPELAAVFSGRGGDVEETPTAYLFPLVVRQLARAVLVVAGPSQGSGAVDSASLELLCGLAALRIESLGVAPPVSETAAPATRLLLDDLTPDDLRLHLQAQRVARVKVASMRIDHEDALRNGVASRDIYGALHTQIDDARRAFLQEHLSRTPSMVDYLHLEILHTLAHNDDQLLGNGYPGPMV